MIYSEKKNQMIIFPVIDIKKKLWIVYLDNTQYFPYDKNIYIYIN